MSDGRCETCLHWKNYDDDTFGECDEVPSSEFKAGAPAYAADPTGMMGALMTRPDFGCVLWTPKDEMA